MLEYLCMYNVMRLRAEKFILELEYLKIRVMTGSPAL
jgi:hypothetical protein